MKRVYETPVAQKVSFRYQEQVASSLINPTPTPSISQCMMIWRNQGENGCTSGNTFHQWAFNQGN